MSGKAPSPRPSPEVLPAAAQKGDAFEARRTSRVSKDFAKADGDVWQENLAVCEAPGNKLLIRSYYINKRTGKRVWDEPPSGASKLLPATEDMRRMANIQMQEMQLVLGVFPEDTKHHDRKKGGLFRWKGKPGTEKNGVKTSSRIQYKPGSSLAPKPENARDDTMDPDIQKAISLSLGSSYDNSSSASEPKIRAEIWQEEEDEAVAMAKALSLSVNETSGSAAASSVASSPSRKSDKSNGRYSPRKEETEEEILARVMELSRLEAERRSSSEEEKREVDADLFGSGELHLGHNIASNGAVTRSPARKSLSPKREGERKPSLSPKRDEQKPSVSTPPRVDSKHSTPSRGSSRIENGDARDDKHMMHLALEATRRQSSLSPKKTPANDEDISDEEDEMLLQALAASMLESDRIAKAQERIAGASQRGSRTITPTGNSMRSSHQRSPPSKSSTFSNMDSVSEHRRRSVYDFRPTTSPQATNHDLPFRNASEHRRRSVNEILNETSFDSSNDSKDNMSATEHRRRTVELSKSEHRSRTVQEFDTSPLSDGRSEHRRRSVHDEVIHASTRQSDGYVSEHRRRSVLDRDPTEHRRRSVHEEVNHGSTHQNDDYASEHRLRRVLHREPSERMRHSVQEEVNHFSTRQSDGYASEHRRRTVPGVEPSEHRRRSVQEDVNHVTGSTRQNDGYVSEHRRRSVHDAEPSQHRRRSVQEDVKLATGSTRQSVHDAEPSQHRRRSVQEDVKLATGSTRQNDGYASEHRRRSVHDAEPSQHRRRSVQEDVNRASTRQSDAYASEHRRRSVNDVEPSEQRRRSVNDREPSSPYSPSRASLKVATPKRAPAPESSLRGPRSSFKSNDNDGIFKSGSGNSSEKAVKGVRGNELRGFA